MAKKVKSNEIERAIDPVDEDGVTDTADDITEGVSKERQFSNAPVSLAHLVKFRAEFEKLLHATEDEIEESGYNDMTDAQRQRLLGSGIRRLGFIVKTAEIAADNPQFIPGYMDLRKLEDLIKEITETRNIVICLEQLQRIYNDILLIAGNDAYRISLMYYNAIQDAAKRGIPGAKAILRRLEPFFRRGRQTDFEEITPLTNKETLRETKKILTGKADGRMIIEGHGKHATAAEHTVVEDIHRPEGKFKETAEGVFCSNCHTHNAVNAKFCNECGAELKR
jgi:hypothetical protein